MNAVRLLPKSIVDIFKLSGKKHLVITGSISSGKTTLAKACAEILCGEDKESITTYAKPKKCVFFESSFGDKFIAAEYDKNAAGEKCKMKAVPFAFSEKGVNVIKKCIKSDKKWVVIDEIGYVESGVAQYETALKNLFSKKHVIAVVRKQDTPFSAQILNMADAFVYDLDKPEKNKKLPKRLPILSDALACFDNILCTKLGVKTESNIHLKRLVICMPPSSGKTYAANAYTVLTLCHHHIRFAETGIIRMTNNMDNAKIYGSQVHNMMTDPVFVNVFPEYRKYITADNKNKLFSYESAEQYLLRDCSNECFNSIFMFGWDSGINGKRSLLGSVLDDISDGTNTMDSDDFHKKQTAKVMTDVTDRNDSDDCPIIIMGTMYNENDVQNTFIDMWERNLEPHPYLRNVQVTKDGTCGVCLIDIENESGNSIAPELYPDSLLQSKKEFCARTGKMYMYNLIYRQKRDSREPKTFALNTLKQYTSLPKTLSKTSKSFIDTTRKNGSDYFAQPFCYYDEENNLWYLVDCIFEQKSLGIISDPKNKFKEKVCNKIIANNTTQCGIESNTSNTTGALLKDRLTQLGYTDCRFIEKYTYGKKGQSKFTRILDMEEAIKEHIVFPSPLYGMSTEMQRFMEQLTGWNSKGKQGRANPDDAIDSIALFAKTFIQEKKLKVEINSNLKMSDIFG